MSKNKEKTNFLPLIIFILSLLVITLAFNWIGTDRLRNLVEEAGVFGPLVFILIHSFTIVAAPLEGSVLMLISSQLFGFWQAVLYVIIAGFLGSSINFWLARLFGQKILLKLLSQKRREQVAIYSKKIDDNIFVLVPLMLTTLFDILGYTAGLSQIKYRTFMLAVAISSLSVPFYVLAGDFAFGLNWYTLVMVLIGILIFFSGYYLYHSRRQKKPEKETQED